MSQEVFRTLTDDALEDYWQQEAPPLHLTRYVLFEYEARAKEVKSTELLLALDFAEKLLELESRIDYHTKPQN